MAAATVNPGLYFVAAQNRFLFSALKKRIRDSPPTPPSRTGHRHQSEDILQANILSEIEFSRAIGCGSFGEVYEAKFKGKKCAVKVFRDVRAERKQKFPKELNEKFHCLRKLAHPNIVRCVGVHCQQPPMMVMELMDESLTTYVDKWEIRINTKLSLLHDVAKGLQFLHSRSIPVVHGDLSSNSILLKFLGNDGTLPIAKIADLGLLELNFHQCGNKSRRVDFLAPEGLTETHNTTLDIFSFGGVTLHIITQEWPTPLNQGYKPTKNAVLSEIQRRQKYLDILKAEFHKLIPLVEVCLSNDPACRPSAAVVLEKIESELVELNNLQRKNIDTALCEVESMVAADSLHDDEAEAYSDLKLSNGAVFKSILKEGGQVLQDECDQYISQHGTVQAGDITIIGSEGAGKTSCEYIIHKVGSIYYSSNIINSEKCMMGLNSNLRDVLQKMEVDITSTIQLTYLLPFLRQKHLVTEAEFQQLSSDKRESYSEKNGKLIRIIMRKGEHAFDLFVEALQEEQEHLGHSSLANKLVQERNRLQAPGGGNPAELSSKPRRPEPLPCSKKPTTFVGTTQSTKLTNKLQQQDTSGVKYTLSVQDQNYPSIMTDERLLKQLNHRLSTLEEDAKTIQEAVSNVSLEKKVERAIENIENKLEKLTDLLCSQSEPTYYTMTSVEAGENSSTLLSSGQQSRDKNYVYTTNSIYETIAKVSSKGKKTLAKESFLSKCGAVVGTLVGILAFNPIIPHLVTVDILITKDMEEVNRADTICLLNDSEGIRDFTKVRQDVGRKKQNYLERLNLLKVRFNGSPKQNQTNC